MAYFNHRRPQVTVGSSRTSKPVTALSRQQPHPVEIWAGNAHWLLEYGENIESRFCFSRAAPIAGSIRKIRTFPELLDSLGLCLLVLHRYNAQLKVFPRYTSLRLGSRIHRAQSDMKTSRRYRTAVWYAGMILLACLASGCGQKRANSTRVARREHPVRSRERTLQSTLELISTWITLTIRARRCLLKAFQ